MRDEFEDIVWGARKIAFINADFKISKERFANTTAVIATC
jgi:hypothetical protein